MTKQTAKKTAPPKERRPPTDAEKEAGAKATPTVLAMPTRPKIKVIPGDTNSIGIDAPHSDVAGWRSHLQTAFGSRSFDYADEALTRLVTAARTHGQAITEEQANGALALLASVEPKNELEAAIGEQIVAAHIASLDFLCRARANAGQHFEAAGVYAGMATKLSRTMATHIEALAKLRNGGKQQVIVKHIYVDARGSQNVIGSEVHGGQGGAALEKREQPLGLNGLPAPADAVLSEVWSEEPERHRVPGPGDAR